MFLQGLVVVALLFPQVFAFEQFPWHQYYKPSLQRWEPASSGKPTRIRAGYGRYRMVPGGAELTCQFPSNYNIISNIIWERADMGALKSLDEMYKRAGEEQEYRVISWTNGSRLQLRAPSSLARGLYRCMATALNPNYTHQVTVFQDVPFYPNLESNWRSDHLNQRCCRSLSYDDFRHHSAYVLESLLYYD
ncbi:uncharacterized protein [Halyomorpha halys]|uniref:uncharacterized protein n=1 Tax=Halyomorpha halys TaxID=286706 RepID=UPI0006D4DC53|nr:uncharacterized protein LOC106691912 [Halyomorpha halys]